MSIPDQFLSRIFYFIFLITELLTTYGTTSTSTFCLKDKRSCSLSKLKYKYNYKISVFNSAGDLRPYYELLRITHVVPVQWEWSLLWLRCGSGFIFSLNCCHNNPDPADRLIADPAEFGSGLVKAAGEHPPGRLIRGLWASRPWRNKPTRTHSSPSTRSSCRTWKNRQTF